MDKIVVFDFDKTLTIKDTNLDFYKYLGREQPLYILKLLIYFGFLVVRKLKVISNTQLKNLGYSLFLKGKNENEVILLSENYSKRIKLNQSLNELLLLHKKENNRIVITTASLTSYVNPIFPGIEVVGSELDFTGNSIKLKIHCYKQKKVDCLKLIGINNIDILYTDSLSDLPLAKISRKIYLVKGSSIIECKSIQEFITAIG